MKTYIALVVAALSLVAGTHASMLLSGDTLGGAAGGFGTDVQPTGLTPSPASNFNDLKVMDSKTVTPGSEAADATKTDDKAKAEKEDDQKACDDATKKAAKEPNTENFQIRESLCKRVGADISSPAPQSAAKTELTDYAKQGDAYKAMIDPNKQAESKAGNAVTMLKATATKYNVGQEVNLNSNLMSGERLKNLGGLSSSVNEGVRVGSVGIDEAASNLRYDPAKVVVGGTGSGIVRCSGSGPSCPGGKYGVDTNDGSVVKSLTDARYDSFEKWDLPQTETGKLNEGYLVDSSMPKGTTSSKLQVASMFQKIGESKGMSQEAINVVIGTVQRESSFNTNTGPGTTSAYGYGQYVGDTWLKHSSALQADGSVLNRNDSFNQASVLLDDINNRYNTYQASSALQSRYTFGEYDYIIHHDGSILPGNGNNFALNYYRNNMSKGQAFANYAANGSSGGVAVGGGSGVTGGNYAGGGGINTTTNAISTAVNALGLGNVKVGGVSVNQLLSGNGYTNVNGVDVSAIVASLIGSALSGSGSDEEEDEEENSNSNTGTATAGSEEGSVRGYELAKACGTDLPSSTDSVMLMIQKCQEAKAAG